MESDVLPEDPAKQWEILLCIIAFEEKNNNRRADGSLDNLAYFWKHHGIRHIFGEWLVQMKNKYDCKMSNDSSSLKSDEISLLWRKRGNVKYKAGNYRESLQCYTKAVLYAVKTGPMYSLALANRSAATVKLGLYKESLTDVHRAFCNRYPIELQHKLFLRRAECFVETGHRQAAAEAVNAALDHNEKVGLTGHSLAEFERLVNEVNEKIATSRKYPVTEYDSYPQLHNGENPNFRGASMVVDLKMNEQQGRHVVTNRPVKRGDVLFVEQAFASVRLSDKHLPNPNYCDFCCAGDESVIGCDYCSRAVFCSESCLYHSNASYHRWECPGVRANIFNVIGISHLALRVLIQYAQRGFPRLPAGSGSPRTAADLFDAYMRIGKVESFKRDLDPFYTMFHLSSNVDAAPITDNIQYALTATMLTLYLETCTPFFDFFTDKVGYALPPEEMKLLACALIFRTLGQLVINAHTVLDINTSQQPSEMFPGDYLECFCKVGTAIYPAASMMNHSCDPNIINVFYRNQLFVKGNKEIPEGAEVFNSYGPHYAREALHIRKEKLQAQYGFNCACQACSDDSRKDFTSLFVAFSCPSCKGPVTWVTNKNQCHQCTNEFPLLRAQTTADTANALHASVKCKRCSWDLDGASVKLLYDKGIEFKLSALRGSTPEERCELMARAYRLMQQVLYRHHNVLRKTVDDLARLYASNGDYSRAVELIKQNVQSFEYQFGSFSVEVTNEIRKMANLMLGRIVKYFDDPEGDERQPVNIRDWMRETLKIVKKANQLMELNFGTWKPMYANLKGKETLLEELVTAPRVHNSPDCINYKLQMMNVI
ncbi:SET and MYND domain-containing protein 4-like isoform X3 [Trichoplusia ni]|uniref:Protein-lysine N-methyltransferase SMYD4 n=1 Tax=Trichoplusia ni TaxID=7111 RepID=A0A7E5WLL2_TRINI|nr:SET and MYND domain-containing protein 4-like isoform X3 [Trichoplusia ni]